MSLPPLGAKRNGGKPLRRSPPAYHSVPGAHQDDRKYIDRIRKTAGPYTDPIATSEEAFAMFRNFKVL